MKGFILIILSVLLLASCVTQEKCNIKFPPEIIIKDSVHTETVIKYKDTTIYVPGDTIRITDTIECDELGRVNMPFQLVMCPLQNTTTSPGLGFSTS